MIDTIAVSIRMVRAMSIIVGVVTIYQLTVAQGIITVTDTVVLTTTTMADTMGTVQVPIMVQGAEVTIAMTRIDSMVRIGEIMAR